MILTERSRPSHTFMHISNTHLPGERSSLYGSGPDADANLDSLLSRLVDSGLRPDALLFTGDLADLLIPRADAPHGVERKRGDRIDYGVVTIVFVHIAGTLTGGAKLVKANRMPTPEKVAAARPMHLAAPELSRVG